MNDLFKYVMQKTATNGVKDLSNILLENKNNLDSEIYKKDMLLEQKVPELYMENNKLSDMVATDDSKKIDELANEIRKLELPHDALMNILNQPTEQVALSTINNSQVAKDKLKKALSDSMMALQESDISKPLRNSLRRVLFKR